MKVIFKKEWLNPDTNKIIKPGQFCDLMEWMALKLQSEGIADIIQPVEIIKTEKPKEMQVEEIQDANLDQYTPKKKKFNF